MRGGTRIRQPRPGQIFHVVWYTQDTLPPRDPRGEWGRLAEFYAPLIADNAAYAYYALQAAYSGAPGAGLPLSEADGRQLCRALIEATQDTTDRLTGGCALIAATFLPTQAHALFRSNGRDINLIVGRLKSRIARTLIAHGRWRRPGRDLWGAGFWAAEIMDANTAAEVKAFIRALGGVQCAVP